jgi:hypothetical protein
MRLCAARLVLFASAALAAACTGPGAKDYPLAETARPLGTLSGAALSAPPVARDVTFERIVRARSEPHNWLTYIRRL